MVSDASDDDGRLEDRTANWWVLENFSDRRGSESGVREGVEEYVSLLNKLDALDWILVEGNNGEVVGVSGRDTDCWLQKGDVAESLMMVKMGEAYPLRGGRGEVMGELRPKHLQPSSDISEV